MREGEKRKKGEGKERISIRRVRGKEGGGGSRHPSWSPDCVCLCMECPPALPPHRQSFSLQRGNSAFPTLSCCSLFLFLSSPSLCVCVCVSVSLFSWGRRYVYAVHQKEREGERESEREEAKREQQKRNRRGAKRSSRSNGNTKAFPTFPEKRTAQRPERVQVIAERLSSL